MSALTDLIQQVTELATEMAQTFNIRGVKSGGAVGQVLKKTGTGDFETGWVDEAQGPQGPKGDQGPQGPQGIQGPPGSDATVNAANVAAVISGASAKTTPVDPDSIGIIDSAASGALKNLTFANLWLWIKSKLDTALTIAGDKTFTGTVAASAPGTAATSVLTREGLMTLTTTAATTLTLNATNAGAMNIINLTSDSAIALTVASGMSAGMVWNIRQKGLGPATVTVSGGTVNGNAVTAGQHTSMVIVHVGGDTVDVEGGLP